jgi:hypothetical protein
MAACCGALGNSCTRRSRKRSKLIPPSWWTVSPSCSRSITPRPGSSKNPLLIGAKPVGGPPPARRRQKRPPNFENALDQLALLPDNPERQRQELEFCSALGAALMAAKGYAAPETGHAHARARELWEQLGSPSEFLRIPYGQSLYHAVRGELDLAQRLDEDSLRLSRQNHDAAGLVLGHASAGRNLMFGGRFALSRSHLEEVFARYDPNSHRSLVHQAGFHPRVNARGHLGVVLFCLGYPDQALAQSSAAIAEARRLAHPPSIASSLALGGRLLSLDANSTVLGDWIDQLVVVTAEQGLPHWRAQGTIGRGWVKVQNGDVAEGSRFCTAVRRPTAPRGQRFGCRITLPYWRGRMRSQGKLKRA